MKKKILSHFLSLLLAVFSSAPMASGAQAPMSDDTESCIDCHVSIHTGLVLEWKKGRMSQITPKQASLENVPEALGNVVVGCAECHTMNPESHPDSFDHNGFDVHVVVSPADCAACHPTEETQYRKNLMSHAHGNLVHNPLYKDLVDTINGAQVFEGMKTVHKAPDAGTNADSCLFCHGTIVQKTGMQTRETDLGEMTFPMLSGWPNQGVGRINPDKTKGSCAACHSRHRFSIEMARKPYTCAECHQGPDVPAYKVYKVSKHGNIFSAKGNEWDFKSIPWRLGKDFTAPTCATCHVSLVTTEQGEVIAQRTHQMNDRIPWRIFGLIYAHPHPKDPDTTVIKNNAGLPLPTELTGGPVEKYVINAREQEKRLMTMQKICLSCHSQGWVAGQFARLENSIHSTNQMTRTATDVLLAAWEKGAAKGLAQKDSLFNEAIEKKWVEQWLFYANSTRFSSAMMGADYGVFANGRWYMSKNIQEMIDWLEFKQKEGGHE